MTTARCVLPGLDNHAMGTIFEELIRRFNEENNEEAGEHWTPRDVVKLMADLIFAAHRRPDQVRHLPRLRRRLRHRRHAHRGGGAPEQLADEHGKQVSVAPLRPGDQPETYAIARPTCCSRAKARRRTTSCYGFDAFGGRVPRPRVRLHALQSALRQELEDRPGADGRQRRHARTPRFVIDHAGDRRISACHPLQRRAAACSWRTCWPR